MGGNSGFLPLPFLRGGLKTEYPLFAGEGELRRYLFEERIDGGPERTGMILQRRQRLDGVRFARKGGRESTYPRARHECELVAEKFSHGDGFDLIDSKPMPADDADHDAVRPD